MEWYEVLAVLIGGLVVLMMLGLPVVFAFFTVNIAGAFVLHGRGDRPRAARPQRGGRGPELCLSSRSLSSS